MRALAVIVALLALGAASAHADAPEPPPTRGESVAPPRLNPQPEPPGIGNPTGFRPYEIEYVIRPR